MFNVNLKFNYNIDERFDRRLIEEKLLLITSLKKNHQVLSELGDFLYSIYNKINI